MTDRPPQPSSYAALAADILAEVNRVFKLLITAGNDTARAEVVNELRADITSDASYRQAFIASMVTAAAHADNSLAAKGEKQHVHLRELAAVVAEVAASREVSRPPAPSSGPNPSLAIAVDKMFGLGARTESSVFWKRNTAPTPTPPVKQLRP